MLEISNFFEAIRPKMAKFLNGFTASGANSTNWAKFPLPREEFPIPDLLLVLLRDTMKFRWAGPGEKVRWTIYFWVDNRPFAIELAKFGLRLHYQKEDQASIQRVCGQLQAALGQLEKQIKPLINNQIAVGNVTLQNRSSQFHARYRFFRGKADTAFDEAAHRSVRSAPTKDVDEPQDSFAHIIKNFSAKLKSGYEGFYYSVAMVDAYFSYLEHRLVLLRVFQGAAVPSGGTKELFTANWDDKLKIVLGEKQREYATLLGRLRTIKENIRNPFAHGGSQNDGGSIFCHFPGITPIPGNLSHTRDSANFKWIPLDTDDHQTICQLFDDTDTALRSGPLERPSLLTDGGIHPVLTSEELAKYEGLCKGSIESVQTYIEYWNHLQDKHENMDY